MYFYVLRRMHVRTYYLISAVFIISQYCKVFVIANERDTRKPHMNVQNRDMNDQKSQKLNIYGK